MKPSTSDFMIAACGDGSTTRGSPGAASPNWNARESITIVRPAVIAPKAMPRSLVFCWAAGVEPSQ